MGVLHNPMSNANIEFSIRALEIIDLLLEGKTNKEMATSLGICQKTVEFHLNHIYSKLNVHSRTEAVIWLLHQRL